MSERVNHAGLAIDTNFHRFINEEVLPGTGIEQNAFWDGFAKIIKALTPENRALLAKRDALQEAIDTYHRENRSLDTGPYTAFLRDIGYLVDEPQDFAIETKNVEPEIAKLAGPQLVVPVSNARFALNAANARWGSLYDALYGSDVLSEEGGAEKGPGYNPARGFKVMAYGRRFLDQHFPLEHGSHIESTAYSVVDGALMVTLNDSTQTTLKAPEQLSGFRGLGHSPQSVLLKHNGLHVELLFDPEHPIGQADKAGIKDIELEAALTTIMDCEDSVAAVDAEDKINVYRNWLGLMKGTLSESFDKDGKRIERVLAPDRHYTTPDGESLTLKGRSLMFVRNVGHLMTNPTILDEHSEEVFEGIMDAVVTSLAALHDIRAGGALRNSSCASINIVKPKMHGPEEVAFSDTLFALVEDLLALPRYTLKMGIMDEERRTSVNLKACIHQARNRVVFINTGFLDRTGDEIHTSMEAGVVLAKEEIKQQAWISAYEARNVATGLACGLSGKAQIGKGMWPMPDKLALMMETKQAHPLAGANTAWVPSPTAATLHAMHYHEIDVFSRQNEVPRLSDEMLTALLTPPLANDRQYSADEIQRELDNNAQGILGYVVRWVEQGVGCSKVPDINHVGLMEDRATLRISSQHIANWLRHGVCSKEQVLATMKRMAKIVDGQNEGDAAYRNMADSEQRFEQSHAFQAALALVFEGCKQPNGYTEPLLHAARRKFKESL